VSIAAQLRTEATDYYREAGDLWREVVDQDMTLDWRRGKLGDIAALAALSTAASSLAVAVDLEGLVPRPIQLKSEQVRPFGSDFTPPWQGPST
jgi:hypothetical protein